MSEILDHRCKHSEHGIEKLLSGGNGVGSSNSDMDDNGLVGTFLPFMKKMERVELMAALEEDEREANDADNRKRGKTKLN